MKQDSITFNEQVVVITGAGRGLGASYARQFASRGAHVVVHDAGVARDGSGFDEGPANSVAQEIQNAGGKASTAFQNLNTAVQCQALINDVLSQHGRIDVLIHNAGLVTYTGIEATTDEEWARLSAININAPFWLCRAVWPIMRQAEYGRIVLTASGYGLKAWEGSDVTAYGIGKAAQFGLMNGLAGEGMAHNIKVNAISPVAVTRIYRAKLPPNVNTAESVAPGVVLLGSKECPWTGKVLQAVNNKFVVAELENQAKYESDSLTTPEELLKNLGEIK
ncbi:MAG: SDR family NAD(P)-dependent oxidoreductase [Chloroflexota bacterium]